MNNAARENLLARLRPTSKAGQFWGSTILIVVTVAWTLAMSLSLRQRFLDVFVAGTSHGHIGFDFFGAPRGFHNLLAGSNIFLTEMDDFGPYASMFLTHPMVAVIVGPWTAPLEPWTAYGVFVVASIVLLAVSAAAIACQIEGRLLRAFTLFALFCSLPTYLMLWNAQAHVFLVLAVALMLGGLVGLERDEQRSTRSLRMLQLGLLISLLSKPLVLLALPVLYATRETRRALIVPVVAYAIVSVLFLLIPPLNSGGYNGIHWLNLLDASSGPRPMYSLVFPREVDLIGHPEMSAEIYGLPVYWNRLTGADAPLLLLKLPVLAILAMSPLPFFLVSRQRRIQVLIATVMLCLLSFFLCCYPVYEYHYTTLLPMLPVLWWMAQREDRAQLRWLLWIAFVVLLANFLPTLRFLDPQTPIHYLTASTLLRVVPVIISFVSLLLYCVGNWWAASQAGAEEWAPATGQQPELIGTGAVLTLSCAAVLASVLFSVPDRLMKPFHEWDDDDRTMHFEDLLARPHPGLKPAQLASLHSGFGRLCFKTNPSLALEQFAEAVELTPDDPELLSSMGDRLWLDGQVDRAIAAYRRVLELVPDDEVADSKLRELRRRSRPGMP